MPNEENFDDLLKRLDGLERFSMSAYRNSGAVWANPNPNGAWFEADQVKTIVGQWVGEQRKQAPLI